MNINKAFPSKYMGQPDITDRPGQSVDLTISGFAMEAVDDKGEEIKPVLFFERASRGMILNKGNGAILGGLFGEETNGWIGHVINVYIDPSVTYQGNRVGGLRVRLPAQPVAAQPATALAAAQPAPAQTHAHNLHQATNELPPASAPVTTPAAVPTQAAPVQGVQASAGPDPNEPIPDDDLPF